ncbi:hypothetical protein AB4Y32_05415 [Paraburkholderia phymatum]|uniref:Uncharacterized protein n=1 Tax=Paraburkholderia phymatum TaxID=148447 RepID=A0ACC6TVI4_9BURK
MRKAFKRFARPGLARMAAFLRNQPAVKQSVADTLRRYPKLRSQLIRIVGAEAALGAATSLATVTSVNQLTARGRAVYHDLMRSKSANRK